LNPLTQTLSLPITSNTFSYITQKM
jgi:hypothetical protein